MSVAPNVYHEWRILMKWIDLGKVSIYPTYPSLDFFDIGLEDYGRRASSFSRYIQQLPPTPVSPLASSASSSASHPMAPPSGVTGRRRRTCSFSKVLSRNKSNKCAGGGGTFGSGGSGSLVAAGSGSGSIKHPQRPLPKNTSSLPSVRHIPSLVTAVWMLWVFPFISIWQDSDFPIRTHLRSFEVGQWIICPHELVKAIGRFDWERQWIYSLLFFSFFPHFFFLVMKFIFNFFVWMV